MGIVERFVALSLVYVVLAACSPTAVMIDSVNAANDPVLAVRAGECGDDSLSVTVEKETAESVSLRVESEFRGGGGDCLGSVQITLDTPLGDRDVVDVSTGRAVSVSR